MNRLLQRPIVHDTRPRGAPIRILVVPDGAAERLPSGTSSAAKQHHDTDPPLANGVSHTSLQLASTPVLDELARTQGVGRVRTIPRGFQPGTETGLLSLLGYRLQHQIGRGWIDAAALGLVPRPGQAAWRLDVREGHTRDASLTEALSRLAGGVSVGALTDDRHVLIGPQAWGDAATGHDRPMPVHWTARLRAVEEALQVRIHVWGVTRQPRLQPDPQLAVLPGSPACFGVARLLGATILTDIDEAASHIRNGTTPRILVHDAHPDEASHAQSPVAKIAAIETFDHAIVAPIVHAADHVGAQIVVAPDHGADPRTGEHTADPVPATWPTASRRARMTEAAVANCKVVDSCTLFGLRLGERG